MGRGFEPRRDHERNERNNIATRKSGFYCIFEPVSSLIEARIYNEKGYTMYSYIVALIAEELKGKALSGADLSAE